MNIKVSGITTIKQLNQLDGLNVEYAGLVFYEQSTRNASGIIPDLAKTDLDIKKVGIFMNEDYDAIMRICEKAKLDMVQLHGDESPFLCEKISNEVEVIKTFRIDDQSDKSIDYMLMEYDEVCDYYLFDALNNHFSSNSEESFNWEKLLEQKIEKPFFIGGGINPGDAAKLKKFRHPDFFGADLMSLFEKEPGVTDMSLILKFLQGLKQAA